MKAGTRVEVILGRHKGKQGKIMAKKRGSQTIEEGKVNVEIAGEAHILPKFVLREVKKDN